eukprot:scaffold1754_cov180-Ochromonas_danica.AAC.28
MQTTHPSVASALNAVFILDVVAISGKKEVGWRNWIAHLTTDQEVPVFNGDVVVLMVKNN